MASINDEFRHESLQDTDAIIQYLSSLIEGFKKGEVVLGGALGQVVFHPEHLIKVDVRAQHKNRENRIAIRFSWTDNREEEEEELDVVD